LRRRRYGLHGHELVADLHRLEACDDAGLDGLPRLGSLDRDDPGGDHYLTHALQ
jgi:hypothetical protein